MPSRKSLWTALIWREGVFEERWKEMEQTHKCAHFEVLKPWDLCVLKEHLRYLSFSRLRPLYICFDKRDERLPDLTISRFEVVPSGFLYESPLNTLSYASCKWKELKCQPNVLAVPQIPNYLNFHPVFPSPQENIRLVADLSEQRACRRGSHLPSSSTHPSRWETHSPSISLVFQHVRTRSY